MKDQNTPTNTQISDLLELAKFEDEVISGWNKLHTPTLRVGIEDLIAQAVNKAQKNAVAWTVSVVDEMHIKVAHHDDIDLDRFYKGVKNTIRSRYEAETGIDPAPDYPIKAELNRDETPNQVEGGTNPLGGKV